MDTDEVTSLDDDPTYVPPDKNVDNDYANIGDDDDCNTTQTG